MKREEETRVTAWFEEEGIEKPDFNRMWEQIDQRLSEQRPSVPLAKRKSWRKLQWIVSSTAVACMLSVAVGAYVSPAFAAYLKSFFERNDVDMGLQAGAKQGFAEESQLHTTDQGITLKVLEVLADPSRVVMTVGLEQGGKQLDASKLLTNKILYSGYSQSGFYLKNNQGWFGSGGIHQVYRHSPYIDLEFLVNERVDLKQLALNMNLKQIGEVKGNWKLEVPIDMQKSLAATQTIQVNQDIQTPQGLIITWKDIIQTPTTTRINLDTHWTSEALKKIKNRSLPYEMVDEIMFHLEDEQGKIVATSDFANASQGPILQNHDSESSRNMERSFQYSFVPLDKNHQYTLVLDGVNMLERADVSYPLDLTKLASQSQSFDYKGCKLTFSKFRTERSKDGEETGRIEIDGSVTGSIPFAWTTIDQSGKSYSIDEKEYSNEIWNNRTLTNKEGFHSYLKISGLTKSIKQVNLSFDHINIKYRNFNDRIPFPKP
ncbi:DUF4179 domain-containing protein [Brevibacillus ginsengisoli]|uniref:DUF4179 domain-containing protein n=1 Tax=Brevibacillus ginsengisoli TaxID=363854 RepID=UPI003CF5D9C4